MRISPRGIDAVGIEHRQLAHGVRIISKVSTRPVECIHGKLSRLVVRGHRLNKQMKTTVALTEQSDNLVTVRWRLIVH